MAMRRPPTDHVEPAHPTDVLLHEDLIRLYTVIREKYQDRINQAFDEASRNIGFVVTTTLPYVLEVADGGKIERISIGAKHLAGTIFDKEVSNILSEIADDPVPIKTTGSVGFYVVWSDALKLKLRADWIEPAHFRSDLIATIRDLDTSIIERGVASARSVTSHVKEPVHWFDSGIQVSIADKLVISAIDQVYPELKLVERMAAARKPGPFWPGTQEPAHMREDLLSEYGDLGSTLQDLATLLHRNGF